ncbi:MAG: hypothetical protein ACK4IY_04690 [Chitinophagales bacterium]
MNKFWRKIGFLLSCLVLLSTGCDKEGPDGAPFSTAQNFNRSIHVTVQHVTDSIYFTDTLVANAEIKIYSSYDQFITDGVADAVRFTDSAGVALFEYRDADYYWIKCFHPALGFLKDSVSTPPQTVSFVKLYYYF